MEKKKNSALGFIFVVVLLDVLSFGVTIPVLPALLKEMMDGDTVKAATLFGYFGTAWALMQFIFSPIMGALSDRFGRRSVLLISCFGLGFDYIFMALAPSWQWLMVGRIISGITAASFSTAGAYIADVTPPEKRSASYGLLGAAFGLGFVLGPAFGGMLGYYSERLPFWVAAGLTLANACYGYFVLPESLSKENRRAFSWSRANPVGSLKLLNRHATLLGLAAVGFIYQLAHQVLQSVFVLYTQYRYEWTSWTVGFTLGVVGVCSVLVQGGLVRPLVGLFGERKMLLTAILFGAAGFAAFGFAKTGVAMWASIPILAGMGFFMPSCQGLMTRRVGPDEHGQLQGTMSSLSGIAGMFGPTLFTSIFSWSIASENEWKQPGMAFYMAALLMIVAWPIAFMATKSSTRLSS